mgnify:FL=1
MTTGRIEEALALGQIYQDGTYKYFGEAESGTPLNGAKWRVSRINLTTNQVEWANVDGVKAKFNNLFTDLATAAALTYS